MCRGRESAARFHFGVNETPTASGTDEAQPPALSLERVPSLGPFSASALGGVARGNRGSFASPSARYMACEVIVVSLNKARTTVTFIL